MRHRYLYSSIVVIILLIIGGLVWWQAADQPNPEPAVRPAQSQPKSEPKSPAKPPQPQYLYSQPAPDFINRVTKKFFGTYVEPGNSPVSPERFKGYHTGADGEYGDIKSDVPVSAIAAGQVVAAEYVSGYGGAVAVSSVINGEPRIVIYGHLDPGRLPSVGQQLKQGQQFGYLGVAYSHQTDGERRNLHLAVLAGDQLNWLGYVPDKSQLSGWLDPLVVLRETKP